MTKELEALEHIYYGSQGYGETDKYYNYLKEYLEAIDNAKPSEALKGLKHIKNYYVPEPCSTTTYDYLEIIEQALIKSQEQEKVLEIIKEKCLRDDNLYYVRFCINYDEYKEKNSKRYDTVVVKIRWKDKNMLDYLGFLTQDEFDFLKRWLGND